MSQRGEEDLDRELIELLNELRVALPGVQVLFAFLLIVPFSQGYSKMSDFQKDVYVAALMFAALASILLIAPSAFHRLQWRQHDKEWVLATSNRLAIAGTVFLALGMTAAVLLITDVVLGKGWSAVLVAATAAAFAWFWYGWPLLRRLSARR